MIETHLEPARAVETLEELAYRLYDRVFEYLVGDGLDGPNKILEILTEAEIRLPPNTECQRCDGSGEEPETDNCLACEGSGKTDDQNEPWVRESDADGPADALRDLLDLIDDTPEALAALHEEDDLVIASANDALEKYRKVTR